jgi:hypothetical protein
VTFHQNDSPWIARHLFISKPAFHEDYPIQGTMSSTATGINEEGHGSERSRIESRGQILAEEYERIVRPAGTTGASELQRGDIEENERLCGARTHRIDVAGPYCDMRLNAGQYH